MKKLKVDDAIIHVPEGVCRVAEIIDRDLSGTGKREYYVLVPVYEHGSKLYIPTDCGPEKFRPLPKKKEVKELIASIPKTRMSWIESDKDRQEHYTAILGRCEMPEMTKLVATLRKAKVKREKEGKKFHSSDERIAREAERIVFGVFSYVLGIDPEGMDAYIAKANGK